MRGRRGAGWFGAAVLIAVGVIGLAVNFNLVPPDFIDQLWKLWPVIPLALGLSFLVRRQQWADDEPQH
jgi:cadmium resistance protein CadD (predicted permease)